jgi:hypothetical protein
MTPSAGAALRVGLLLLVVAGGCGGDDTPPPNADVSGSWSGTWRSDGGPEGTLQLTFAEKRPGGASADLYDVSLSASSGAREEHAFGDNSATTIQASATASVVFPEGAGGVGLLFQPIFDFHATVEGQRLQGTYQLRNTGSCLTCPCGLGTAGTWTAAR